MGVNFRSRFTGRAPDTALALAREFAAVPYVCMRHDPISVLTRRSLTENQAIASGMKTLQGGGRVAGATRFADREGRGRRFDTPQA
jgi:enoyl-CoA hydratase